MKNEVLLCDCMEYMKTLPDKAFDLAIVDPPYGIGEGGKTNISRSKLCISKDYKDYGDIQMTAAFYVEIIRVSIDQVFWGANHYISKIPFDSSCWIVWDKNNGANDFADCELAWSSFKSAVRKIKFTWNGMRQENMKNKEERIHPNQKPVALYKWLLQNYAKPGQTIFDSHVGSGSIRIACHDLGFDFVGCEIDRDYWEAQEKRYQEHAAQQSLFEVDEIRELTFIGKDKMQYNGGQNGK